LRFRWKLKDHSLSIEDIYAVLDFPETALKCIGSPTLYHRAAKQKMIKVLASNVGVAGKEDVR
jgi:hypothetical protein